MGVQILIRESETFSPFKKALYDLMSFKGDEVYICVGYAYENVLKGDDLFKSIAIGFKKVTNPKVTFFGGMYNSKQKNTRKDFLSFCESFKSKFKELFPEINVTFSIIPYNSIDSLWHGKLYIKLNNKQPIGIIIGSSNLSKPALDLNHEKRYNEEVDLFIWNNDFLMTNNNLKYEGVKYEILPTENEQQFYKNKLDLLKKELIEYLHLNGFIEDILGEVLEFHRIDVKKLLDNKDVLNELLSGINKYIKISGNEVILLDKNKIESYIQNNYLVNIDYLYTDDEKLKYLLDDTIFFINFIEMNLQIEKLELMNEYLNIYDKFSNKIKELENYKIINNELIEVFTNKKNEASIFKSISYYNQSKIEIFDKIYEILDELSAEVPQEIIGSILEYCPESIQEESYSRENFKELLINFLDEKGVHDFKLIIIDYLEAKHYTIILQYLTQIRLCNNMLNYIINKRTTLTKPKENFVILNENSTLELLMGIYFKVSKLLYKYESIVPLNEIEKVNEKSKVTTIGKLVDFIIDNEVILLTFEAENVRKLATIEKTLLKGNGFLEKGKFYEIYVQIKKKVSSQNTSGDLMIEILSINKIS